MEGQAALPSPAQNQTSIPAHSHGLAAHSPGPSRPTACHGWAGDHTLAAEPAESRCTLHSSGPAPDPAPSHPGCAQPHIPLLLASGQALIALQAQLHTVAGPVGRSLSAQKLEGFNNRSGSCS